MVRESNSFMTQQTYSPAAETSLDKIDSRYAWRRLVASLIIGSVGGVGMWSSVILLPEIQSHFNLDRSQASLPYTVAMVGIVFGNVFMGRMVDKFGVVAPTLVSAVCLGLGYSCIAFVSNFWMFLVYQGIFIGIFGEVRVGRGLGTMPTGWGVTSIVGGVNYTPRSYPPQSSYWHSKPAFEGLS